jgi:prepilin-type N-terminal cleavage/methylation domain-containing protein/prepilin-type processing-associated H-X9-DG protein
MKTTASSKPFPGLKARPGHPSGMTLVELLVVIAIIAVLAGIGFPTIKRLRERSQGVTCATNLKQVGAAILMYASEHNNKLPPSPAYDTENAKDGDIWTMVVARAGYLWDNPDSGAPPCGKGVWTCPGCDFMSNAYGGYGVVENAIFVRENAVAEVNSQKGNFDEKGSLRLTSIPNPSRTWLVGDAAQSSKDVKKGWYAIWSRPAEWDNSHTPAERHGGRANVCMFDGHIESLTVAELKASNYVIKNH